VTDTPPRPCALEHAIPARHRDDCDGHAPAVEGQAERKPCRGCLPALADQPLHVCRWHAARVTRALGDIPDLVAHLHTLIEPGSGAGEERVTRGELAPPAPLSVDAISAADDILAILGSWADRLAAHRSLTGPTKPSTVGWRRDGSPGILTRRRLQIDLAVERAGRLLTHQDAALTAPWAAAYVRDITRETASLRARYPTTERPVFLPVPCPACGAMSLARWAPRWVGAPTTIACELDDCRTVVDEDRYPWLVRLAADLARERRTPA
jgi:hypothetical protein